MSEKKYIAFLSYSHEDEKYAKWLHEELEKYKIPNEIIKKHPKIPKSLYPIFRDRLELSTGDILSLKITSALKESQNIIVLCSKKSARSKWVNQEIIEFKKSNGEKYIYPVILDGQPFSIENKQNSDEDECFPNALKYQINNEGYITDIKTEILAGDIIEGKDGKELGIIKLISGLLGISLEELNQREQKRRYIELETIKKRKKELQDLNQKAKQELIRANHNLGLVFYEKSNIEKKYSDFNKMVFYSINSLLTLKKNSKVIEKNISVLNSFPVFPVIFSYTHNSETNNAVFSPDNNYIASSDNNGTIKVYEIINGNIVDKFKLESVISPQNYMESSHNNLQINENNTKLFVIYNKGLFIEYSLVEKQTVLKEHWFSNTTSGSFRSEISPNGKFIAYVTASDEICLWNIRLEKKEQLFEIGPGWIGALKFSPESNYLAASSNGKSHIIKVWELSSNKCTTFEGHSERVEALCFSPDEKMIVSGSDDHTVIIWDIELSKRIRTLKYPDAVWALSISANNNLIAVAGNACNVEIYDMEGILLSRISSNNSYIRTIVFSSDSNILAVSSGDKSIKLWDLTSLNKTMRLNGHIEAANIAVYSPVEDIIISGSNDCTIKIWDAISGKLMSTMLHGEYARYVSDFDDSVKKEIAFKNSIQKVTISPDGKLIASSTDGALDSSIRNIKIWSLNNSITTITLSYKCNKSPNSISFSHDSKLLAAVYTDTSNDTPYTRNIDTEGALKIWDLETGEVILTKLKATVLIDKNHSLCGTDILFSPLGSYLACSYAISPRPSNDDSTTIIIFKTDTYLELVKIKADDWVRTISFSPDEKYLAFAGNSESICIYHLDSKKEIQIGELSSRINCLVFSSDSTLLASGDHNGCIKLWDMRTCINLASFESDDVPISSISFSVDNNKICYTTNEKTIKIIDIQEIYYRSEHGFWKSEIEKVQKKLHLKYGDDINAYKTFYETTPPRWSYRHTQYWHNEVTKGNIDAILKLAILYDRIGTFCESMRVQKDFHDNAKYWYKKSIFHGSERAKEKLIILEKWLKKT